MCEQVGVMCAHVGVCAYVCVHVGVCVWGGASRSYVCVWSQLQAYLRTCWPLLTRITAYFELPEGKLVVVHVHGTWCFISFLLSVVSPGYFLLRPSGLLPNISQWGIPLSFS